MIIIIKIYSAQIPCKYDQMRIIFSSFRATLTILKSNDPSGASSIESSTVISMEVAMFAAKIFSVFTLFLVPFH